MANSDDKELEKIRLRALGNVADEFSEHSKGAGAHLGRTALVLAKSIEAVITSPRLIKVGWEVIREKIQPDLHQRLAKVPPDRVIEPPLHIAGPALEGLRFTHESDEIRDMFISLLATSMDAETAQNAHPAFVEIIKQLGPDEARILRYIAASRKTGFPVVDLSALTTNPTGFTTIVSNYSHLGKHAGAEHLSLCPQYVDNLCRLELCTIPSGEHLVDGQLYERIIEDPDLKRCLDEIHQRGLKHSFVRKVLEVTNFGQQFIKVCIKESTDVARTP